MRSPCFALRELTLGQEILILLDKAPLPKYVIPQRAKDRERQVGWRPTTTMTTMLDRANGVPDQRYEKQGIDHPIFRNNP